MVLDALVILRGALTGLLALPTSKTSIGRSSRSGPPATAIGSSVFGAERLTYAEANATANRYAAALAAGNGVAAATWSASCCATPRTRCC